MKKRYTLVFRTQFTDRFISVKAKNAEEAYKKVKKILMEDQDVDTSFRVSPKDSLLFIKSIEEL